MHRLIIVDPQYIRGIIGRGTTLLCISPISPEVIRAGLLSARNRAKPIVFIASLNQVDIDGGYTGLTPRKFRELIDSLRRELNVRSEVILEADHVGPWLKDEHVYKRLSYEDALNSVMRSIEEVVKAGYDLIHIDTTVDLESPTGYSSIDDAVNRAVDLIEYAENLAKGLDVKLSYEVGSDRWKLTNPLMFEEFLRKLVERIKAIGGDVLSRVIFSTTDVGLEVRPGNRINPNSITKYVEVAKKYNTYLKIHSGDYLENAEILTRLNVGGLNIGPMLADITYKTVKNILIENLGDRAQDVLDKINQSIISADKLSKYTKKSLSGIEEYKLGIASRYIWSKDDVRNLLLRIGSELDINVLDEIVKNLTKVISNYLDKLSIQ